jgi:hypothetical protein
MKTANLLYWNKNLFNWNNVLEIGSRYCRILADQGKSTKQTAFEEYLSSSF